MRILQVLGIINVMFNLHVNTKSAKEKRCTFHNDIIILQAYYGGMVRCDEQIGLAEEYDEKELVCGGCSDVSRAQVSSENIFLEIAIALS